MAALLPLSAAATGGCQAATRGGLARREIWLMPMLCEQTMCTVVLRFCLVLFYEALLGIKHYLALTIIWPLSRTLLSFSPDRPWLQPNPKPPYLASSTGDLHYQRTDCGASSFIATLTSANAGTVFALQAASTLGSFVLDAAYGLKTATVGTTVWGFHRWGKAIVTNVHQIPGVGAQGVLLGIVTTMMWRLVMICVWPIHHHGGEASTTRLNLD